MNQELGSVDEVDSINRAVWMQPEVVNLYGALEGWTDPGEEAVLTRVGRASQRGPILDIGVGGGRTVALLRQFSDDYVGIDYMNEMVHAARVRYPDARFEQADARDLSRFSGESFVLAVFSFNGIDYVAHEDRQAIFAEVLRVLRPGGWFAYSTHNRDYRDVGRPPWDPRWFFARDPRFIASHIIHLPKSIVQARRVRLGEIHGDGWAILNDQAHEFAVLNHFVSLDEALREPTAVGFTTDVDIYDTSGAQPTAASATAHISRFHLIARKPFR
jgi:SAM-dependent methyltransferase